MSNQLDNFFKNKLQQRSFDYDEQAWEEARLLIEAEERKKRRRKIGFFLLSAGLFMLVSFSAYYIGKQSATTTVPFKEEIDIKSATVDQNLTIAENTTKAQNLSENKSKETLANDLSAERSISTTTAPNADTDYDRDHSTSITNKSTPKTELNDYVKPQETRTKKLNLGNATGVASTSKAANEPTTTSSNPNTVAATPQLSDLVSEAKAGKVDLAFLTFSTTQAISLADENIDFAGLLPPLAKADNPTPIVDPKGDFYFGLRAGTALIPLDFMDFEGGVEIGYNFNRNWSIAFQPKYQYQALSNNAIAQSEVNEFAFGLRTSAYSLEAETVRSIHLPLMVNFAFGNKSFDLDDRSADRFFKNRVSVGLSYVYLDGITGTIYQKEAASESSVYQTGWLAANTFNRHNAELILGYDRLLTKRLSIGLQARYRMRDQFAEEFTLQNPDIVAPSPFYLGLQTSYKLF